MSLYYPVSHTCGGEIQMWPQGYGVCLNCGVRIKPKDSPEPEWGGYSVITVHAPVTKEMLDAVDAYNSERGLSGEEPDPSVYMLVAIIKEIDDQNGEGMAQLPYLRTHRRGAV